MMSVAHTPEEQNKATSISWSVRRRFEFMEFRIFWEEKLNRKDLMEFFEISVPQASADLSRYQEQAPGNIAYDKKAKCYVATPEFSPQFLKPDSSQYLAQLRSISVGILAEQESWIPNLPSYDVLPLPRRDIDPKRLQTVLRAIRKKKALKIRYQSLSRPEPMLRWITPHAIGFDGYRWHARAFCHIDEMYKDFLFARILDIKEDKDHEIGPIADYDWHEKVEVCIGPNPGLKEDQQRVVATDYGMEGGELLIMVRRAFLFYFLKQLGLQNEGSIRSPEEQHIVLINRDEIFRE
jgi:hypothetical protein